MRPRIPRVLVVEDNTDIARLVKFHLSDLPAAVTLAADGASGLACTRADPFDLLVLDVSLPGLSGIELLTQARAGGVMAPALLLSGQALNADAALAQLAPIECMQKPFGVTDFVERARRLLQPAPQAEETLQHGPLLIDVQQRRASLDGAALALEDKAFELLLVLAREPDRVFTRRELREALWGAASEIGEHAVNALIGRLRAQLEADPHEPKWICSGSSGGYQFNASAGR